MLTIHSQIAAPWRRVLPLAILTIALCVLAPLVLATDRDLSPAPPPAGAGPEPNAHHSYVRGVCPNGLGLCIVATDAQYAADIRANFTGLGGVDIVMQQCFGGGFKNDIQTAGMGVNAGPLAAYTFAAASTWGMVANGASHQGAGGALDFLENFTRPWRKDAQLFPGDGLFARFRLAAGDGVVTVPATLIPKDLFAPPGTPNPANPAVTFIEYPQYASPDMAAGGVNDSRPLPPPANGRRFAILVSWDTPLRANPLADDFAVGIARINDTLYQVLAAPVPIRRIVVLYANTARNTNVGPFPNIPPTNNIGDGNFLVKNTFFVDGPNSRANWLSALKGGLFISDNTPNQLGVTFGPNDSLFIYNTGHGGNENVAAPAVAGATTLRFNVPLASGGFQAIIADEETAHTYTDPDGTDLLQLSTRRPISDAAVQLVVNGTSFGSLASLGVSDASQIFDLGPFVFGSTFTYQVRVEHALLAGNPATATIDLINVTDPVGNEDLLAAATFRGGEQEYMARIPLCDFNGDGIIDSSDIAVIFNARNETAAPGDPRDVDGDGLITVNDARICAEYCTNANCAH